MLAVDFPSSFLKSSLLLELSPAALLTIDHSGRILAYNQQVLQVLELSPQEVSEWGDTLYKFVAPTQTATLLEHIKHCLEIETRTTLDLTLTLRTGKEKPMRLSSRRIAASLLLAAGSLDTELLIMCSLVEIPDLRLLEDKLLLAREQESQVDLMRALQINNLSHDLKTSLHAILNISNLLLQTDLNKDQRIWMESIAESSLSLVGIANELTNDSALGDHQEGFTSFNIRNFLSAIDALYAPQALSLGLEWQVHLQNHQDSAVYQGEPNRLRQILAYLIDNALRYTEEGRIDILLHRKDYHEYLSEFTFEIRDSGPGIGIKEQATLSSLLESKEVSHLARSGQKNVGLSLARDLARNLGGQIYFESTLGMGSSFFLSLPLHRESSQPATT